MVIRKGLSGIKISIEFNRKRYYLYLSSGKGELIEIASNGSSSVLVTQLMKGS